MLTKAQAKELNAAIEAYANAWNRYVNTLKGPAHEAGREWATVCLRRRDLDNLVTDLT